VTDLPRLLDCKGVMRELGVTRGVAESVMRRCEKVIIGRRVFVRHADVAAALEQATVTPDGFRKAS